MWVTAMRTTLDLPDDILRRARIEAVERGSTLRPPVKLAADAPLRRLRPEAVKRLDAEDLQRSEARKARALHR